MAIRRGNTRLNRLCKKCGKLFEPSGRYTWICNDCKPQTIINRLYKLSQNAKRKREEKLKEKQKLLSNANNFQAKKKTE